MLVTRVDPMSFPSFDSDMSGGGGGSGVSFAGAVERVHRLDGLDPATSAALLLKYVPRGILPREWNWLGQRTAAAASQPSPAAGAAGAAGATGGAAKSLVVGGSAGVGAHPAVKQQQQQQHQQQQRPVTREDAVAWLGSRPALSQLGGNPRRIIQVQTRGE